MMKRKQASKLAVRLLLLSALLVMGIMLLLCACGSSSDEEGSDNKTEYANTYQLEDMSIGLSDRWTFRTKDEISDDINCSFFVPDDMDEIEGMLDYCAFYDSMDTDDGYVFAAIDNTDGAADTEALKEAYDELYPNENTEFIDINGQTAFIHPDNYDDYLGEMVATIYNNKLYTLRHTYTEDSTNADFGAVLNGITFGGGEEAAAEEESNLSGYTVEDLSIALSDKWEMEEIEPDGNYSFADQSSDESLITEKAFEYSEGIGTVLVYCYDGEGRTSTIEEVKANLIATDFIDEGEASYIEVDGNKALRTVTARTVEGYDWTYLNVYLVINSKLYEIYCPYTSEDVAMDKYFDEFVESITIE